MRIPVIAAIVIAASAALPRAQTPEPLPLATVLRLAADYVDAYAADLTGVVLQEQYIQDVRYQVAPQVGLRRGAPLGPGHRRLKSDLLLIRPENADTWRQFRDVFEVDRQPVRDRDNRLAKLFLKPNASAQAQAHALAVESARYNIGDITRDINLPLLTLLVIDRAAQPRFRFSEEDPEKGALPRFSTFKLPAAARIVRYEEVQAGTLIRGAGDRDLPITGRLWLEPDSGRVLLTELIAADRAVEARIHVGYQLDSGLKLLVPIEMHEAYERVSDKMRIEGIATYSNFRRFKVQVDESLDGVM